MVAAMRSRASFSIALCALAICLSGQIAEVFDQWDHTAQTGNDTEYTFVIVALCVGACYSLKQFVPEIDVPGVPMSGVFHPTFDTLFGRSIHGPCFAVPGSPPSVSLRI